MLSFESTQQAKVLEEHVDPLFYEDTLGNGTEWSNLPILRTSSSFMALIDQLLPMDVIQERSEQQSRLRFELPATLEKFESSLPTQGQTHRRSRRASSISRKIKNIPDLGNSVQLLRRPLPTLGTVKFIGLVHFSGGQYIGIELERRCDNDGSIDGLRYFRTDPQRGLFVKPEDLKIIHR